MSTNRSIRRNSQQRQVILEELQRLKSHPTAADLYEIVRRRLPRISLGTVYRNLELLAEQGTIRRLDAGAVQARFDGKLALHHHIRCQSCGSVDDIELPPLDLSGFIPQNTGGYEVYGHRLEFFGICPQCRKS
jgi:Fur family transcriptional regulator, ferric uptake regulator